MEDLKKILEDNEKIRKKLKSKKHYRWQEQCDLISKYAGLSFGVLASLWRQDGYKTLDSLESQVKQKEITPLQMKKYILWLLKKNK